MSRIRLFIFALPLILVACTSVDNRGTIAQLRDKRIEIKEEKIDSGLEKAMAGYQRFLKETPDSALAPEAIRRLADLKVESEYGLLSGSGKTAGKGPAAALPAPDHEMPPEIASVRKTASPSEPASAPVPAQGESETDFERRAAGSPQVTGTTPGDAGTPKGGNDLEKAGPLEAIALYQKLLKEYPYYERNDQVLYQMSRAYEELGRVEEAMEVMDRLVREFPQSRYTDEVQFRRAESFFVHRKYLDAEDAYKAIVNIGVGSSFYQLALYKLGWTYYKQELYEEALDRFIALLDYKVSTGYDFAQTEDELERQRMEDTFRVISLSFSYLGGPEVVADYFSRNGKRSYEDGIYRNLGEYYFDKRRYSDAVATYHAFVSSNPYHKMSPHFLMRVIEINIAGGFPSLVIDSKKEFATKYGLKAEYWKHFDPKEFPEVLGYLKTNLTDLANHYHALYQDPKHAEEKRANFKEALHWYREFLASFPKETESPAINYQLADLLLENRSFEQAAVEFEKTAYDYPPHEKSSKAGYAAVYAYRKHLENVSPEDRDRIRREVVHSSLKFADTFPDHEKAAIVLGAAADDLYDMKDYQPALAAAQKLVKVFPGADADVQRSAWLVVGHSSYELLHYSEAETAYVQVLALLPPDDKTREGLVDNLAASIYKQGEQAKAQGDFRAAADHFLRVGQMAPGSKIRPTAEYDAAAALIELKDWGKAATVLVGFRKAFPGHELQPEVTKKIAYVYKEEGQLSLAADEYERIERESKDDEVRREALTIAAQMHEQAGEVARTLEVYRRYVEYFPQPVEINLETRNKIAEILKAQGNRKSYLDELREIVAVDASAGSARTDRTRYLAAKAGLVLAELTYDRFVEVRLEKPIEVTLRKKRDLMKASTEAFGKLLDYEVGEVTAAATFYLAEIYAHFSIALTNSERPDGLSPAELEQYNLAIEEQAYPFEEKAIDIHEKNLQLISQGIYNEWIDKSLQKLAKLVPARFDKPEEPGNVITSMDTYVFAIEGPAPPPPPVLGNQARPVQAVSAGPAAQPGKAEPAQTAEPAQVEKRAQAPDTPKIEDEVKADEPAPADKRAQNEEPLPVEKSVDAKEQTQAPDTPQVETDVKAGEPASADRGGQNEEPVPVEKSVNVKEQAQAPDTPQVEREVKVNARAQGDKGGQNENPVQIAKPAAVEKQAQGTNRAQEEGEVKADSPAPAENKGGIPSDNAEAGGGEKAVSGNAAVH
jgi:tetratricopeptide (TPR) repeat protein